MDISQSFPRLPGLYMLNEPMYKATMIKGVGNMHEFKEMEAKLALTIIGCLTYQKQRPG
jgi:hypothetical protein